MSEQEKPEPWSIRRWKQLETMRELLQECTALNRGNCVIHRMQKLINEAEKLLATRDGKKSWRSFVQFLEDQARFDYLNRRRNRKKRVTT